MMLRCAALRVPIAARFVRVRAVICQVRYNRGGKLWVPRGYIAALQVDPIEKKPFFHLLPNSSVLTFGMLGCDMHCGYCQNWMTSQALRDRNAGLLPYQITPEALVATAQSYIASAIASSYNEPLITSEWAVSVLREAKRVGLLGLYVSNGNATREALEFIRPYVEGYKIDLKTMSDKAYRRLGAVLDHVLTGIRLVHEMGFWLEIVTLVVPGFNDSEEELRDAACFIKSISADISWHVTAFHPDYRMQEVDFTSATRLLHTVEIGFEEGLHYVYTGNIAGQAGRYDYTRCPTCGTTVVRRRGFKVLENVITQAGECPQCKTRLAGLWNVELNR
jgi:pyruvate formate lyase activating enzyme